MKRKPIKDWHPTGWAGRLCVEATLVLPGGMYAVCHRTQRGDRWRWRIAHGGWHGVSFKTLAAAQIGAENDLRIQCRLALSRLEATL